MRPLLLMIFCTVLFTTVSMTETHAQDPKEAHFVYTDMNTHVTYGLLLKFKGKQVEVFTNSTNAPKWLTAKVLYVSESTIKYQVAHKDGPYEITLDPNKEDAIYIKNTSNTREKLRYYRKE